MLRIGYCGKKQDKMVLLHWQPKGTEPPSRFKRDDPTNPSRIDICRGFIALFYQLCGSPMFATLLIL